MWPGGMWLLNIAIVRAEVSHSPAKKKSNYVGADSTSGFQLCVRQSEREKAVKTTDNDGAGSWRGEQ